MQQKRTPIKVGATAGLRLLPGGKADDILAAVKDRLSKEYPFQLEQVTIIDGASSLGLSADLANCLRQFTRCTFAYFFQRIHFPSTEQTFTCAGTDEGGFAWLTLNYLLGHLGQSEGDTVAAIDLVRCF